MSNVSDYNSAKPRQLGTLHERMKFLIDAISKAGYDNIPDDVWNAVYDLQTEVMFYKAVSPPYGLRLRKLDA